MKLLPLAKLYLEGSLLEILTVLSDGSNSFGKLLHQTYCQFSWCVHVVNSWSVSFVQVGINQVRSILFVCSQSSTSGWINEGSKFFGKSKNQEEFYLICLFKEFYTKSCSFTFYAWLEQQSSSEEYQAFVYCDVFWWIVYCIESLSQHVNHLVWFWKPYLYQYPVNLSLDLHCLESAKSLKSFGIFFWTLLGLIQVYWRRHPLSSTSKLWVYIYIHSIKMQRPRNACVSSALVGYQVLTTGLLCRVPGVAAM